MLFFSCKIQQSRSAESKQNFFFLIFPSAISLSLVLFSLLKDGGKIQGQKLWSIHWPYLKLFPKSHKLSEGGWREFLCPCLDWHWPLKPTTREHITWETIQSLTGKICAGNIFILHGILWKSSHSGQDTKPCTARRPLHCFAWVTEMAQLCQSNALS